MPPMADLVLDAGATVAECPVWVPEEQALYWTDIPGRTLNRFDPATGANRVWPMPQDIGCFALRENGGLVAAMRYGFGFIDLESGTIESIVDPEAGIEQHRMNDGRCDRQGRFFAGSMNEARAATSGALYRFDPDHSCTKVAEGAMVSNGLAWSPDGKLMYWSDSSQGKVWLFDYDTATGTPSNQRLWMQTDDSIGRPDGATVDADGCYWSARFFGGRVIRFTPDGRIDREVRLPVSRVTMCAFGGPDLKTLYITTAREGMSEADLAAEPLAGGIFAIDLDIAGLPEPRFAG